MSQDTVGSQGRRQLAMYEPVLYFLLINRDDGLAGFFAPGGTRTHDRTMFALVVVFNYSPQEERATIYLCCCSLCDELLMMTKKYG